MKEPETLIADATKDRSYFSCGMAVIYYGFTVSREEPGADRTLITLGRNHAGNIFRGQAVSRFKVITRTNYPFTLSTPPLFTALAGPRVAEGCTIEVGFTTGTPQD